MSILTFTNIKGRVTSGHSARMSLFSQPGVLINPLCFKPVFAILFFLLLQGITAIAQTKVGNQDVINLPINLFGQQTQALLSLPDDYATATAEQYPLLIFLHGTGEAGTNIKTLLNTAIPQRISRGLKMQFTNPKDGKLYKFIVVSPQAPSWSYQEMHLQYMLPEIQKRYRVDASRIYVTGLSAGGYGTWTCVTDDITFCNKLAAVAPISAATLETTKSIFVTNAAISKLPVWSICGMDDSFWGSAQEYTNKINSLNPAIPAKLTGLPGVGHSAWNQGYDPNWRVDGMNVYEWMLQFTRSGSILSPNRSPIANAGADVALTLPQTSTALDGSASSDPDGSILFYKWTVTSGPSNYKIDNSGSAQTTLSQLQEGIYTIQLTVTDNKGAVNTDNMTVTVQGAALPPVANAGSAISLTLPQNSTPLDGSASAGVNGSTLTSYQWAQTSGPSPSTLTGANTVKATASNLVAGTYTYQLTVTDSKGLSSSSTVTVTVAAAPQPPVANAGAAISLTLPQNSTPLDGSASAGVNGSTLTSYQWAQTSGPSQSTLTGANTVKATASNLVAGTYTYQLTITDSKGQRSSSTVTVTVNASTTSGASRPPAVASPAPSSPVPAAPVCSGKKIYLVQGADNGIFVDGTKFGYAPGDTLVLKKSAKAWSYVSFDQLKGTATCPVTIINEGGQVLLKNGFALSNSRYVKLVGTGSSDKYGFRIEDPTGDGVAVDIFNRSSDVEVSNVDIYHKTYGFWVKQDASCIDSLQFPKWVINNITLHDNRIVRVTQEGMYLGSTDPNGKRDVLCNGVVTHPKPLYLGNIKIYNNLIDSTWRSGIQLSSAPTGANEIYNNHVTHCGYEINQNQGNGISLGGYTAAYVHDNYISNTYALGILVLGAGNIKIDNNDISNSGQLAGVTINGMDGIMVDTRPTDPVDSSKLIVTNNKIKSYTGFGVRFYKTVNTFAKGNIICNNTGTVNIAQGIDWSSNCAVPPNQAPIAVAGKDQLLTLPLNTAQLDGSASTDPDGSIAAYAWTKLSGPSAFTIQGANTGKPSLTSLVAGTYTLQLTVTDNKGATGRDTITISVAAAPVAGKPVAHAGSDTTITLPAGKIVLDGSGSVDPGGSIVRYVWRQLSGSASLGIDTSGAKATVSGLAAGIYTLQLTVTDNDGSTSSDTLTLTVLQASNAIPVAKAGSDITLTLPKNTTTLDGAASTDADGRIVEYTWTQLSGPAAFTLNNLDGGKAAVSSLAEGRYTVQLTVKDDQGASSSDTLTLTVLPAPPSGPSAYADGDAVIRLPKNFVNLNGAASTDNDGTIVRYDWVQVSGPAATLQVFNGGKATLDNLQAGIYQVQLTVTDNNGLSDKDTATITVLPLQNLLPVPKAGADITLTLPQNSTTLDASASSDPDGTIVQYAWTKLSGPSAFTLTGSDSLVAVSGLTAGTYVVQLKVTDNAGGTAMDTVTIRVVTPPNQPPVANAGTDLFIVLPVSTATLDGTTSADVDGSIVKYAWKKLSGPAGFSIKDSTTSQPGLYNLQAGIYTILLTVTDNEGATATDTVQVQVNIKNNERPRPVINGGTSDTTITLPVNALVLDGSASSDPDGSLVAYGWALVSGAPDAIIDNAAGAVTRIHHLSEGTYVFSLTVADNEGARSNTRITVHVEAAKDTTAETEQVSIYPNPARSWLNVKLGSKTTGKLLMAVFDNRGRMVVSKTIEKQLGTLIASLNVSALNEGIYFIAVISPDNKTVLQFLKAGR